MKYLLALLAIILATTVAIYQYPRTWELDLIVRLQAQSNPYGILTLQWITDYVDLVSVGIPIVLLIKGFVQADRLLREKAILILVCVALAGLLSNGVKLIVKEPRPFAVDTRISKWSGGGSYGFPSGHTADAVAAAAAFSLLWPEFAVVAVFSAWGMVIMFSRVFLGVHDPGDVLGGMCVGVLSAVIVMAVWDRAKKGRKAEA